MRKVCRTAPPLTALKNGEEGVIDSLKNADLEYLSEDALEIGVIPQDVRDAVGSMDWDHVRRPRVIRYLLMHVYRAIEDSPRLYERWLHVLSEHVATVEVLDKVRERYEFLMQCDNLLAHTEDVPEDPAYSKRPQPQNLFTEQHIPKLTDKLVACAGKYMDISTLLGLPEHVRTDLRMLVITDGSFAAFSKLLREWIVGRHSHACEPTLENLERVLRSEMVGLGEIANQLKDNLYDSGITFKKDEHNPMSQTKLLCRCEVLPLEIVRQSRDAIVTEGKTTLLELQAVTSRDYITYQWMKDGCPLEGTNLCKRYNNILCIRDRDQSSNGKYTCELSDGLNTCSSRPITLTVNISSVRKALVDRYSTQPEVPVGSWPPTSTNTCINLALVKQGDIAGEYARKTIQGDMDDIMTDKESIEYEAAFTNLESATRLLIEGRPGSGKTTLVHRFSKDWARGNSKLNFKNIKLLFLVHLRGFFNDSNITLRDILKLYYSEEAKIDTIIHEAEANSGEGLCLILDGLDEYRPESRKDMTFIFKLIKRLTLPKAIVITASRPAASAEFRNTADKKIEVIGFLKEQIHEYIEKYPFTVPDKGMELHKHLEQHPNIHHMCYLPIYAAMVCYLFNIMGGTLPLTETEMYTEFTNATLLRAIRREEEDEMIIIESPQDLPDHKREMFYSICRLGFEMTLSSKQVMQKMEVCNFFGNVHCGKESMGLITVDSVAKKCGFENLYTFLHLTFQEYLAACHIFQLSETKQLGIFRQYGKARHMQVVWKFYCGLTSFEEGGPEFGEILKYLGSGDLFGVQCAFESQQSIPCDYVVQSRECGALNFGEAFITRTDLTAICYVFENASCCVETLKFLFSNLGYDGAKTLAEGLQHCSSLQTLDFQRNSIGEDGAKALAEGLQHCSSLQTLHLEWNSIGDDGAKALAEGLQHCSSLHTLHLGWNGIGENGAKALAEGLQHCSSLQTLYLEWNSIGDDGAKALAEGLQHCSSLQTLYLAGNSIGDDGAKACLQHCSSLQALYLDANNIGDEGAKALAEGLQHCSSLQTLDLARNSIGEDDAKALAEGLQHCSSLQTLDLAGNSIGDDGAKALAEGLQHCSSLQTLDLWENSIGYDGAKALAEGLQHCSSLLTLVLRGNSIGDDGAKALAEGLQHCSSLQTLDLVGNSIGDDGAKALAEGLQHCSSLLTLVLRENSIGDDGAKALAEGLQHCSSLQTLDLWENSIGDDGAKALAEGLQHCSSLQTLNLRWNSIGDDGAKALAEGLQHCKSLQTLGLEGNSIGDNGAKALAEGLQHCSSLQTLNLQHNSIGDDGAKALVEGLQHCSSLNLEGNSIGDDGAKALAESL